MNQIKEGMPTQGREDNCQLLTEDEEEDQEDPEDNASALGYQVGPLAEEPFETKLDLGLQLLTHPCRDSSKFKL